MKGIFLIISCLIFSFPSNSLASPKFNAAIFEYGIFKEIRVKSEDNDTSKQENLKKIVLVEQTDSIMAKLNTIFGCRYTIVDLNNSSKVETIKLTIKWTFPEKGLINPKTGKTFYTMESKLEIDTSQPRWYGLKFSEPQDFVPGIWKMEILYEGDLLAEKSFNVLIPE